MSSFQDWAGGNGNCYNRPTSGDFMLCPSNTGKHALPWGSPEFIGLGFSVWISIILLERFGSPLMKSCAVVLGLVVGIIISAATGYFDDTPINEAPAVTFIWVKTFHLSVNGSIVLPFLAVFLILMMEAIGDITATCDVSRFAFVNHFANATLGSRLMGTCMIPESKVAFSRTVF
jgi:uric acid-xanthine permease